MYDTGAGNAVTALSSTGNGKVIYAAWVGGGGNPGPSFASGIATNYGGTWHQVNTAGLPDRYIAGVTVDPADPAHAYAIFNGYSRRFVPGGGTGHVFETWNGGQSWTDISGNLPDIASDALVLSHGQLALATDAGVYTARELEGARTTLAAPRLRAAQRRRRRPHPRPERLHLRRHARPRRLALQVLEPQPHPQRNYLPRSRPPAWSGGVRKGR